MAKQREVQVATLDGTEWKVVLHPVGEEWRAEAVAPSGEKRVTRVEGVFRSNGAALREGLRLADQLRREGAR